MTPSSAHRQFGWNLAGNAAYNLSQWLLIVGLARFVGVEVVGEFTLMLAITAPVFLTVGLNLRTVQATDAANRWRMNDFFALQPVANSAAAIISLALGALLGLSVSSLVAMAALTVAKSIEARSQIYYGYFQRHRRFDLLARSLFLRAVVGPVGFTAGVLVTGNLLGACIGLALGWLLCQRAYDHRNAITLSGEQLPFRHPAGTSARRVGALARVAVPLGLDKGVSSLAINAPRYAVQRSLGVAELGVYGSLSYLAQATSMVTSAASVVFVTPLAEYHRRGQVRAFVRVLGRLTIFCVLILVTGPALAWLFGEQLLRILLGEQYADRDLLVYLMIAAGVTNIQRSLCKGLEASLRYRTYLAVDIVTTAVIAASAVPLVARYGSDGAAWALTLGFGLGSLLVTLALVDVVRKMPHGTGGER